METRDLKVKRVKLQVFRKHTRTGVAAHAQEITDLEKDIRESRAQAKTTFETLEVEAYSMGKSHDSCSREFFCTWDPGRPSVAPPSAKVADWSDPSRPIFSQDVATTPHWKSLDQIL